MDTVDKVSIFKVVSQETSLTNQCHNFIIYFMPISPAEAKFSLDHAELEVLHALSQHFFDL